MRIKVMADSEVARLSARVDMLAQTLARLEGKVDALLMGGAKMSVSSERPAAASVSRLRLLTRRQHGALQLLLLGCSNMEIAQRFGVTENTAKVYVRGVAGKLGVTSRAQIVALALPEIQGMSASEYHAMAGIPKDWAVTNEGGLSWFPDGRGAE